MTLGSFHFDQDPVTVTVQAAHSKRRRTDMQVLSQEIVEYVQNWLEWRRPMPTELLFSVSERCGGLDRRTSEMMERDLGVARKTWISEGASDAERQMREESDFLVYRDREGKYADFHATRHTFITNLGRAGVTPKTAQKLARHSDIRLTMNIYSHTDLQEKVDAVNKLPSIVQCSEAPVADNAAPRSPKEEDENEVSGAPWERAKCSS